MKRMISCLDNFVSPFEKNYQRVKSLLSYRLFNLNLTDEADAESNGNAT